MCTGKVDGLLLGHISSNSEIGYSSRPARADDVIGSEVDQGSVSGEKTFRGQLDVFSQEVCTYLNDGLYTVINIGHFLRLTPGPNPGAGGQAA